MTLLDERSRPTLRARLGGLLAGAEAADFAVQRVRIAGIDLTDAELARVRRCRVLVREVDGALFAELEETLRARPARLEDLRRLRAFLDSGRLEIAAAGAACWTPDFSVLHAVRTADAAFPASVVVIGAHYFGRPYPAVGPSLTCIVQDPAAAALAARRFRALWAGSRDLRALIADELDRVLSWATS